MVVVSLGTRTRMVPDVNGMTLRQARNRLQTDGLDVGRMARVLHAGRRARTRDRIQSARGRRSARGRIRSTWSCRRRAAPPCSSCRTFTAQDLFFVREKLERRGFRVASVRYEDREGVYPNTIIDQRPRAGERIREGESIELVASSSR